MPAICPNCLRPVRADAKFCGFCGTSFATAKVVEAIPLESLDEAIMEEIPAAPEQPKPTRKQVRRTVLILVIVLLCLVLVAAFVVHFWPVIIQNLGLLFRR